MAFIQAEDLAEEGKTASDVQDTRFKAIGILLYVATLILEVPGMLARYAVLAFFFWLATGLNRLLVALLTLVQGLQQTTNPSFGGTSTPSVTPPGVSIGGVIISFFNYLLSVAITIAPVVIILITIIPIVFSLATFFLPSGFFLRRFALGAREPSFKERQTIDNAIANLRAAAGRPVPAPRFYYVLDKHSLEAQVIGTTLYLSRGLIRDASLTTVLAHELAHITSWDGRLVLALRRLVLFPVYLLSRTFGQVAPGVVQIGAMASSEIGCLAGAGVWLFGLLLSLAGGGFGLWLLNLPWGWYWKQREYAADTYAAELGQAGNMLQYLSNPHVEQTPSFDIAAPYLILQPPSTELRIDRLEHPENYLDADRVRVWPYLIAVASLLVVVCGLPAFLSAANQAAHSVNNTVWTLSRFCAFHNCEPTVSGADLGARVELLFNRPEEPEGVEIDAIYPNNTAGQARGTYRYVDDTHILIEINQNTSGVPVLLGGVWEVSKSATELRLTSDTGVYVFSHP